MYCFPPPTTSEPSVPPQQVILLPLVTKSFALLPEVPRSIGVLSALWFGTVSVTVAVPEFEVFAVETALTCTVTGAPLGGMMLFEMECGAL